MSWSWDLPGIENQAVLTEYYEHCEEATTHPDISGLEVGSGGGEAPDAAEHGDKGEEGGDTESHPARDMLCRDEEREPGDEDKQGGGDEGLSHMKRESSLQLYPYFKPWFRWLPQMCVWVLRNIFPVEFTNIE